MKKELRYCIHIGTRDDQEGKDEYFDDFNQALDKFNELAKELREREDMQLIVQLEKVHYENGQPASFSALDTYETDPDGFKKIIQNTMESHDFKDTAEGKVMIIGEIKEDDCNLAYVTKMNDFMDNFERPIYEMRFNGDYSDPKADFTKQFIRYDFRSNKIVSEATILKRMIPYYNMTKICQKAGVSYDTFKSFSSGRRSLNNLTIRQLLETMKSLLE